MPRRWRNADESDRIQRDGKRLDRNARQLLKQTRRPSFHCVHCGSEVPTEASHTQHRNHCPLCLWSRHVDESIGDRRSECLSAMEPLGLTVKQDGGELMVVHRCTGCGKLSKNRLAGDDNTASVEMLFESSQCLDSTVLTELAESGMEICVDQDLVQERLWGRGGTSA